MECVGFGEGGGGQWQMYPHRRVDTERDGLVDDDGHAVEHVVEGPSLWQDVHREILGDLAPRLHLQGAMALLHLSPQNSRRSAAFSSATAAMFERRRHAT